ncbi:hypothetical protein F4821DRAFT_52438 [Hypoxylon rubiginosum]|uniref:Uncharacterized protein n=1 Tax=Hypoxylon rubiginosum TaxID=110542 RepID=A0ACC0DAR9_9PEZI|nr:hypothetical protein F4821DRAFT_52438 [Hypoxylon rubiginosum]
MCLHTCSPYCLVYYYTYALAPFLFDVRYESFSSFCLLHYLLAPKSHLVYLLLFFLCPHMPRIYLLVIYFLPWLSPYDFAFINQKKGRLCLIRPKLQLSKVNP